MNHSPSGSLALRKAIIGFSNYKTAEGLSERTVDSYQRILDQWAKYAGDVDVTRITRQDIEAYLVFLRTEYVPHRFGGDTHSLSPKTLRNIYITLASFFGWASREFRVENPMKEIPAPRFQNAPIEPFTQEDIQRMLKACVYSREADPVNRRRFVMRRPTANRDQAVILTLVDTGLRASELCSLKIRDFDPKRGKLEVRHGAEGGAKGGKGRTVFLGKTARSSLWRYIARREDGEEQDSPLFVVSRCRPFTPGSLRHLIKRIADRAGVKDAYPHKFRHTFAISYLRAGGDVFTLQILLGHGSLDMVRHYAQIAQVDVEQAHRKASPVDNWRL
jgi:integrase/recombinase XerD